MYGKKNEKRGKRIRLMKQLADINIYLCMIVEVRLKNKYTGKDEVFEQNVESLMEDEDKRAYLEEFEKRLKKEEPEGIKGAEFTDRFLYDLKDTFSSEVNKKVEMIKSAVDECFSNGKNVMLEIGKTMIRLDSYCAFSVDKVITCIKTTNK